MTGTFKTSIITKVQSTLQESNYTAEINTKCFVMNDLLSYSLIQGQYVLHELGIVIKKIAEMIWNKSKPD